MVYCYVANKRVVDEKLERLYNKKVKCPYCRGKILKYSTKCEQCGITKEQIRNASNEDAKAIIRKKAKGKVLKTKVRPDDIRFGKLVIFVVLLGMFGAHCFYVGRRKRGFIALSGMIIYMLGVIIFPFPSYDVPIHPWRAAFENPGLIFPLDIAGLVSIVIWFIDWANIVIFQTFKYPVRIAKLPEKKGEPKDA